MWQIQGDESYQWRVIFIMLACIQNMTCGGIFYGWSSISSTLLSASVKDGGTGLDIDAIQFIYVAASFFNSMGPLFLGVVLDYYGPRVCSFVSVLLIFAGFILFSFSDPSDFNYFALAMCLISFGGPGAQSAIIHLSNLFPNQKATMTAIITGCFQLSFIIFYVFDFMWESFGWSFSELFQIYCIVMVANIAITLLFWPDKPLNYDDQMQKLDLINPHTEVNQDLKHISTSYKLPSTMFQPTEFMMEELTPSRMSKTRPLDGIGAYGSASISKNPIDVNGEREDIKSFFSEPSSEISNNITDSVERQRIDRLENALRENRYPKALELVSFGLAQEVAMLTQTETCCMDDVDGFLDPMAQSLFQQLTSYAFIRLNVFFIVCSFWTNFYVGTAVTQLGDEQIVPLDECANYGQSLTLFMSGGVVAIPFIGSLMDNYGFPITMLVTIFFGIVWTGLLITTDSNLLYLSFIFYALFRTFLYTFIFSYLADKLGFEYYGILAGVLFFFSGLVGLAQYNLSVWAGGTCITAPADEIESCSHGEWKFLNRTMMVTLLGLLYFPWQDHQERLYLVRKVSSLRMFSMPEQSVFENTNEQIPRL